MRAIVYRRYGGPEVLELAEVETPRPGDGEVLIRIHAASVNPLDWHFLRGAPAFGRLMTGWRRPKVERLGADVAGVVEATGRNVTRFQVGDAVFGSCRGSFAEWGVTPETAVARKPENVAFEEAAAVPVAAFTALQALRDKAHVRAGQSIAINGAAGGVGTFAVQLAKWFGAEVTAVCSTANVEMLRSIGADVVIDYTREDFTKGGRRYDVLIDNIGNRSLADCRRALQRRGIYVQIGAPSRGPLDPLPRFLKLLALGLVVPQKLAFMLAKGSAADLELLSELLASGKLVPVISRRYSLEEVPAAIRHVEEGHARGKVVIQVRISA